jgi:hypothetical protein
MGDVLNAGGSKGGMSSCSSGGIGFSCGRVEEDPALADSYNGRASVCVTDFSCGPIAEDPAVADSYEGSASKGAIEGVAGMVGSFALASKLGC